jgi:hypothetical protein
MFGLEMLDLAIGITFIFLLLSLICSAINELLEAWLKNRASNLEKGIRELLNDPDGTDMAEKLYNHPLVFSLFRGKYTPGGKKLPSYIPSRNFALALMDIVLPASQTSEPVKSLQPLRIAAGDLKNGQLKEALLSLINAAGGNIDKARQNIEDWYDSSMDRVAGWYKRRIQIIIFALGFIVAIGTNADTVAIFKSLANDAPLRSSLIAAAEEYAKAQPGEPQNAPADRIKENTKKLEALGLPIGWDWKSKINNHSNAVTNFRAVPATFWGWVFKVAGWLVTAAAISLGAPFWFDLLNKFMVIRSTVKPHEKSPEEPSEDK